MVNSVHPGVCVALVTILAAGTRLPGRATAVRRPDDALHVFGRPDQALR